MSKLITLPPGVAVYPALSRPDTKFDELGQYKANVKVPADKAQPFIAEIQKAAKAHLGKVLPKSDNACFKMVLDDEGEETGEVLFKVTVKNKRNRTTGKLWDRKPLLIDAKKKDLPTEVAVWGGSVIRVQAEIDEWIVKASGKKGLSLRPVVVQVLELVTGGGGSNADMSAFGEEEGYETDGDLGAFGADDDYAGGAASDSDDDY